MFSSKQCLVVNINIGDVVLRGKQHKNVYKLSILSLFQNHLTCLSVLNVMLWHQRLGYTSFLISWCLRESYVLRKVCMCYLIKLTLWLRMMHRMKSFELGLARKDLLLIHEKGKSPMNGLELRLFLQKVGKV